MNDRIKLVLGALAVAGLYFTAQSANAQISGTPHDFSGRGWGSNEVCVFCHAPHNTNTTVVGAPLWNHAVTTQTFTTYSSATLNATGLSVQGVSKLCLSCHDGLTAVDSFGTRTGTQFLSGSEALGTNLGNDHPIGFAYNAALVTADGGLKTPPSTLPRYGTGNEYLECSTCHNVHSNTLGSFLRSTNAASALCLQCHNK